MLASTQSTGVASHVIAPGKLRQNGICEAFHAPMRDERLNEPPFFSLDAARQHLAGWGDDDSRRGLHAAVGYRMPARWAARLTAPGGRLRGTEALRQPTVAPPAPERQREAPGSASAG